ncbi:hypothetical protein [Rhodococcus opacus]|uniref:hypothetical protein n=1 Tax=Rhodococcus opacus TaxID=37919 RepID=UPI0024BAD9A8|nr:hypothetical protein [Rhodococcus opacus]MDJ0413821.1 hypothetical protein [Rhodococcus opacus]
MKTRINIAEPVDLSVVATTRKVSLNIGPASALLDEPTAVQLAQDLVGAIEQLRINRSSRPVGA